MKSKTIITVIALILSGCGGGGGDTSTSTSTSTDDNTTNEIMASNTTVYQPSTTTGRLLASNCFQCHGTNGTGGFDRISGGDASEVYDYLTQTANTDIMAAHAQGYTTEQLSSLIGYLNQVQ